MLILLKSIIYFIIGCIIAGGFLILAGSFTEKRKVSDVYKQYINDDEFIKLITFFSAVPVLITTLISYVIELRKIIN